MKPEFKKLAAFSLFHFFLGVGYVAGFFSTNALLVSRFGASTLFYVYLGQGILTFLLSVIFYFLADRFSRKSFFYLWFIALGLSVVGCWALLKAAPEQVWIYIGVRAYFDSVAICSSFGFWLVASDYFSHTEAKRRFPTLWASFLLGDMVGGLLIQETAAAVHSLNFVLLWGGILIFSPCFFLKTMLTSGSGETTHPEKLSPHPPEPKAARSEFSGLTLLLFLFWLVYSFFSDSTDYVYNTLAAENLPNEDALAAYFGKVALIANGAIWIYHLCFADRVLRRFGIDFTAGAIPALIASAWVLGYFFPSLLTLSIAQGVIYFFIDYVAIARLHTTLTVYPKNIRGKIQALTEGFGRAAGFVLLFFIGGIFSFRPEIGEMSQIIFIGSLIFLLYPLFFHPIYLHHLLNCLRSADRKLLKNAVQGLGERNKKIAMERLVALLNRMGEDPSLKLCILKTLEVYDRPEAILALLQARHKTEPVPSSPDNIY